MNINVIHAAHIDTLSIYSSAMRKNIPVIVTVPDKICKSLPSIYLLHGFGDSYCNGWINKVKGILQYADRYNCLFVMPDGGFSSWYFDSPVDSTFCYETFIANELVNYIDHHYPTAADVMKRAITGNSMGGHGALFLAIRHPEVFGAAGSMSGGVNLCPYPDSFDIAKRLGSYQDYPQRWREYSIVGLIEKHTDNLPEMIIDCGTEDFFYNDNLLLHQKLLQLHIPHDYLTRLGSHEWAYWSNAIQYQLLFFDLFFQKNSKNRQAVHKSIGNFAGKT